MKKMYPFIINGENVPELGMEVFQFMDFKTLMKCRQVGTEWCDYIDSFMWDRLSKTEDCPDQPFLPDFPAFPIQIDDWQKRNSPRILVLCISKKEKIFQIARLYLRHAKDKNPKGLRIKPPFSILPGWGTQSFLSSFSKKQRTGTPGVVMTGHRSMGQKLVESPIIDNKRPLTTDDKTPL